MQENPGLGVGAPPSVRKGVEPERLRTRGGCSYRSRGTPGFDAGESRFRCRSTALGAKRESSQNTFAPGAGAPTVREESRFGCRRVPVWMWEHRPRCEKGVKPEHFRTRGGCSYGSGRVPVLM